ncbi:cell morphogenesis N-terminal-domain-containing protein [Protomyces lactucae-debilis]|uniref:Cell morphogenesis N-terminal-domain-containing protein n=1 Tax=Protomyces lactucae-debilis TaxID=2754530 RepID=A0A1Y2F2N1_PROLT|nr:cell morphogenesis N-terminal-domain-containing protein [Protomyces lactucae-debilis]ORY78129.1 cell morphogenesis N-terminal-domain-containing protein [Protomyces lactucae-debilis]
MGSAFDPDDTNKSPYTYALHVVFTSFVRIAERKINTTLGSPTDPEPDIMRLLGPGVDPAFDKVLKSLGYIARQNPKPVIDSVMFWRKSRAELKSDSPHPTHTTSHSIGTVSGGLNDASMQRRPEPPPTRPSFSRSPSMQQRDDPARDAATQLDRKSLVSIFILCRSLIEIVKQINAESLVDEVGEKLEEIVFNQLKNAEPSAIQASPLRLANWNLFAELLGCLSSIRFASVSDRFIADLEKNARGVLSKDREARVEMIIHGMKHLHISIYPSQKLEDSSEFLLSLARFFCDAHGFPVKQAYADIFHRMLLPVADVTTAEVNYPTWVETLQLLYPRAAKMLEKKHYWNAAFPLTSTLLCVSPREVFLERWFSLLEQHFSKVKDRSCRYEYVQCLAQLIWVAVFRCPEQQAQFTRKIDTLFKLLFPPRRLQHLVDLPTKPLIQAIRFVAVKHQSFALLNIMTPLVGSDQLNGTGPELDILNPERVGIAVRTFLWILADLESDGVKPSFPVDLSTAALIVPESTQMAPQALNTPLLRDFHALFSAYLCRVASFCDQHFGGHVIVDERLSPINKLQLQNGEHIAVVNGIPREKHLYHDLLAAVLTALPRCLIAQSPANRTIEIICRSTAHGNSHVRAAAYKALKALAETTKVQSTVVNYARFMLKVDAQSESRTEERLKIYIELLVAWIDRISQRAREGASPNMPLSPLSPVASNGPPESSRGEELEMINIWTVIEETEANGFFFLCNQSPGIRSCAIEILRLISRFDRVMDEQAEANKSHLRKTSKATIPDDGATRIVDILRMQGAQILDSIVEKASIAEKSRIGKVKQEVAQECLLKIAESDSGVDAAIWFKVFPKLIDVCFKQFPITVVLSRNVICNRLIKMHGKILNAIERLPISSPFEVAPKVSSRHADSPESMVEQWKLFLIMACSTLTLTDEQLPTHVLRHGRKRSVPVATFERITSARSVFQIVLPLLTVDSTAIREAIVTALGCININLFKTLLEDLQPMMRTLSNATRSDMNKLNGARDLKKTDRLRTEVTHILELTSHFLDRKEVLQNDWIMETLLNYLRDIKSFLSDDEIQVEWEYQRLRRYFCGLLEAIWKGLLHTPDPSRWLPFEGRVSCFRLVEEWCNHGPLESVSRGREDIMRKSIMDLYRDVRDRGALTASMEIEKRNVELASLEAMATLCEGPLAQTVDAAGVRKTTMSFEIDDLFSWIAAIFSSSSERLHKIGRRALSNLLTFNHDYRLLYEEAVHQCYTHDLDGKAAQSYFTVVSDVLTTQTANPCSCSQMLAICLLKAGDKETAVRSRALNLLRTIELQFYGSSCVDNFSAMVVNLNPVVYKRGQYLLAAQLAKEHSDQKNLIFSECCKFFRLVDTTLQRDVVAILLPWIQSIELQLDINGEHLNAASYMVLVNLFEITLRFRGTLLNEVEGLWTALVSGSYPGNVKAILDFTIAQSVSRRDPLFVNCGKQVVVYLSRSPAGNKLMEAFLKFLQPRSMIPQLRESPKPSMDEERFAYVANLDSIFEAKQKHIVFSLGQLALIYMVDLLVLPSPEVLAEVPLLLVIVLLLLDHYIPVVQDQAREMLLYLTFNVCVEGRPETETTRSAREKLAALRTRDIKSFWHYDELTFKEGNASKVPPYMTKLVNDILSMYEETIPDLGNELGKAALTWATSCPVRHMACRSFQVFRCVSSSMNQTMLADMLARLSNTVSDTSSEIQIFAMEILQTLGQLVDRLPADELIQHPQIFWSTVACLDSIHEQEFVQAQSMLQVFMSKIDLNLPENAAFFISNLPPKWEGAFEGLFSSLLKGLRSANCMPSTLALLNRLLAFGPSELVGGDSRLLFGILANVPSFMHALGTSNIALSDVRAAETLSRLAASQGFEACSRIFDSFAKKRFRNTDDLSRQMVSIIREQFFPQMEAPVLIFLLGLLSNKTAWVKTCTMDVLKTLLPFVDTHRAEFAGVGADLISPLLRLLQTDYAQAALEVLDKAISISDGPKDRQVLRMSLGNRTIRKEYEKTATLFGIPDDSGWAIPLPAVTAARTRTNVHAVFYTCSTSVASDELGDAVQFHMDDYAYHAPSQRSETMLSVDGGESSLGDMVSALHSLDVFFTEDNDFERTPTSVSDAGTEAAPAAVYDTRVAAILSRSLNRTPSTASLTSPGFDLSPRHERQPIFSFPRHSKPAVTSPHKSPLLSRVGSDSGEDEPLVIGVPHHGQAQETIDDDNGSEASFKLDGMLKKNPGMRSRLWSSDKEKKTSSKKQSKKEPGGSPGSGTHASNGNAGYANASSSKLRLGSPPSQQQQQFWAK